MADSLVRLRIDSNEFDSKLKTASQNLQSYFDKVKQGGGTFEYLDEGVLECAKALGQLSTKSNTAKGSLSELTNSFAEWSLRYKRMTDEEKKSPFGLALSSSLQQLKTRIDETKGELSDVTKELNGGGGGGLMGALDAVAGKFGLNIQQLAGWGAAIGAAKVALDVSRDAFFQSEGNIDEWGRTVEGAKGAYNTFLDTINSGNWSDFFSNMSTAVQGARDLYDALDRLGSIKSNNAAAIAIVQQQIAQLRLAKQQGENVDEQIKAATAKLAELQGQSVSAGKSAGALSIGNVIRSAYDTQGTGGKISDRNINNVVNELLQDGQNAFDKYAKVYQKLEEKASDTRKVTVGTSITGASISATERYTNLDKLTEEERKQYTLAKAITEAETRIQKGISIYAQAVSEGTANAREEFKGNRYALTGSGGGKSGKDEETLDDIIRDSLKINRVANAKSLRTLGFNPADIAFSGATSMKELQQQMKLYKDILTNATTQGEFQTATSGIAGIQEKIAVQPKALELGVTIPEAEVITQVESLRENLESYFKENPLTISVGQNLTKEGKSADKAWQQAAGAVQSVGQALNQIEDPGAKAMGTVMQAIASIALGFAQAASAKDTTGSGWAWLAWLAAGTAAMATTIATVHSLTHYAEGGIVGGNDYTDNTPIMVSSGELILNRSQQESIASQLNNGNGTAAMSQSPYVTGEKIVLGINNWAKSTGRGQLVFSKS